jgi:hypothetical protein
MTRPVLSLPCDAANYAISFFVVADDVALFDGIAAT